MRVVQAHLQFGRAGSQGSAAQEWAFNVRLYVTKSFVGNLSIVHQGALHISGWTLPVVILSLHDCENDFEN